MTLRLLDYDDFLILEHVLNQETLTSIAAKLKLTQPAITQRVHKLELAFQIKFFKKVGRNLHLTPEGRTICLKAKSVVEILKVHDVNASQAKTFTLGTRPGIAESWVWCALSKLRKARPDLYVHLYLGSGEDLLKKLAQGEVDAIITSAPLTSKHYQAVEIAQESYLMVAPPATANQIKKISDLEKLILIEFDRSFPFLSYVNHKIRGKIKFADVWFLNSTRLMISAVSEGHGVGIVPLYLAKPLIETRQLAPVKLKLDIASDYFRIIYSSQSPRAEEISLLGTELGKNELF